MLNGKKGFERLVWASKNVLNRRLTWLFADVMPTSRLEGPITHFQPDIKVIQPQHRSTRDCVVPLADEASTLADALWEEQLLEWLGLVLLDSPRVDPKDTIDPYLCRYDLPEAVLGDAREAMARRKLHHIQWRGLLPSRFVSSLVLMTKKEAEADWFALNVSVFGGSTYSMICRNGKEVLLWDVDGGH